MPDHREIAIDKVGVKGVRYPITVLDKDHGKQRTVASINMYVNLPHEFKGTHMSRFIEILNEYRRAIDIREIGGLLRDIKTRLDAQSAHLELNFPYFLTKSAPASGAESLVDYDVTYSASIDDRDQERTSMVLHVPITTVCPCSKEISERGAHNQRGMVSLTIRLRRFVWMEDLIRLIEDSGSGQVYALLKRDDEKVCTEWAYDNPRFVEDVVREVALRLKDDPNVIYFKVESENHESIHNHNAYACIEVDKEML